MPVTAKLSRKFYDKLGDEIAAELVDWFNAVDATYKSELREINDLNWERFKATLHEEIALLRAEVREEIALLRAEVREEIALLRAELREEIALLRAELRGEISSVRGEMSSMRGDLRGEFRSEMKAMQANLMKWMFIYWSGTVAAIIGMSYFGPK